MSEINNGGPAFPSEGDGNETWAHEGMTLRDYFAARAMQGYLTHEQAANMPDDVVAAWAYSIADAMLSARSGK